jgi:hypothetical protein
MVSEGRLVFDSKVKRNVKPSPTNFREDQRVRIEGGIEI